MEVPVVHPHVGDIYRYITLPGEVHPLYTVTLFAKVSGYLQTLKVDKGDFAKAGDLIAEIEVPEMQAEKGRHQAELELASAEFQRISNTLSNAQDTAENRNDLAVAKAKLALAKANLKYTESMLNYGRITAPFDGIVTKRYVDPGAFIPAPNAADTPEAAAIINLTDFKTLRLQIPVPELEVPHIAIGQEVQFVTAAFPGKHFDGTVTRFYFALNEQTKTMLTEIQMPNPNLELRPGMLVSGRIRLEKKENVLLIPIAALLTQKDNNFVYTFVDGHSKKSPVITGMNDGVNVEIINGLKLTDSAIIRSDRTLRDGLPIIATTVK
ncbi:MAG: hlyD [Verrucomicrobiales bacterium]|nr:hlyD [Verrucomicrobiales bacterium]